MPPNVLALNCKGREGKEKMKRVIVTFNIFKASSLTIFTYKIFLVVFTFFDCFKIIFGDKKSIEILVAIALERTEIVML